MGIFSRKKKQDGSMAGSALIPGHLLGQLAQVGKTTFGSKPSYLDVSAYYLPSFLDAGTPAEDPGWGVFVDQFVAELNTAAQAQGGWASAGAFYVAKDFVKSEDWSKPALVELMDRGLGFLIKVGANPATIPFFAQGRWAELSQQRD